MPNMLLGDAAAGGHTGSALIYQDLDKSAWSLCHHSEAEEPPLAGTAKLEGHGQIPRKAIPPSPLQKTAAQPTLGALPTPQNPGTPRGGAPFSCLCKPFLKSSKRRRKI